MGATSFVKVICSGASAAADVAANAAIANNKVRVVFMS
jgi:hypothetical protein